MLLRDKLLLVLSQVCDELVSWLGDGSRLMSSSCNEPDDDEMLHDKECSELLDSAASVDVMADGATGLDLVDS